MAPDPDPAVAQPPVDILPIDISAYAAGNTGVPYVTTFDSGRSGPHVMVNALTHGNELCGAYALDFLFSHDVRPRRGRLTLSFANVAAYEAFDPDDPAASRYLDEDLNRLWSPEVLGEDRPSRERERARALRPVVESADYLLDIHSMQLASPALMLCGVLDKGRRLAREVGVPVHVVADAGHKAGARMRDYGAFSDPASPRTALLVECGQHWAKESVEVARETTLRFLDRLGAVDPEFAAAHTNGPPPAQRLIEVTGRATIETDAFVFAADYRGLELIPEAGTVIGRDGDRPVRTPHDDCVLVMPSRRLKKGQTAVRFGRFVDGAG